MQVGASTVAANSCGPTTFAAGSTVGVVHLEVYTAPVATGLAFGCVAASVGSASLCSRGAVELAGSVGAFLACAALFGTSSTVVEVVGHIHTNAVAQGLALWTNTLAFGAGLTGDA